MHSWLTAATPALAFAGGLTLQALLGSELLQGEDVEMVDAVVSAVAIDHDTSAEYLGDVPIELAGGADEDA